MYASTNNIPSLKSIVYLFNLLYVHMPWLGETAKVDSQIIATALLVGGDRKHCYLSPIEEVNNQLGREYVAMRFSE